MKVSKDDEYDVLCCDHEDWEDVRGTEEIVDQRRWVTVKEKVIHHIPSDKYYRTWWEDGSTEYQENDFLEYNDLSLTEVELKEVVVERWVPVDKGESQ